MSFSCSIVIKKRSIKKIMSYLADRYNGLSDGGDDMDIPSKSISSFHKFDSGMIEGSVIGLSFYDLDWFARPENNIEEFINGIFKFKLTSIIDFEDIKEILVESYDDCGLDGYLEEDCEEEYSAIRFDNITKVFESSEDYDNQLYLLYDEDEN